MRRFASAVGAAAALFVVASAPTWADMGERVFRDALTYTVQVRAALPFPFEPDIKGTQRGAGFVVDAARGWVMTNAHVVGRSPARIEVAAHGQAYVDARKLYVDPHLDLALVELPEGQRAGLGQAALDCGDSPGVGHPVGAFGHPWNIRFTGTKGIVSGSTVRRYAELLQTDAPINSGNSGGPLISLETGRVIGINTAQIRGSQNTNFAVAMRYACRVLELMQAGADPSPPDLQVVYYWDADGDGALKVARNYGDPARLDLRTGDIIRGVVGVDQIVRSQTQLFHALRGQLDDFALRVMRDGEEVIVLGRTRPEPAALELRGLLSAGILFGHTPLRDAAEIRVGPLMVHHVEQGSEGHAKELVRGDFVELVDGLPVESLEALRARLHAADGHVTLTLKRYAGSDRVFTYLERRIRVDRTTWVSEETVGAPGGAEPRHERTHTARSSIADLAAGDRMTDAVRDGGTQGAARASRATAGQPPLHEDAQP